LKQLLAVVAVLVFLVLGGNAEAEKKKLEELPISPGAYHIDGKSDAFCRLGPGGNSLVVESPDSLYVFTVEGSKVRLDQFRADGVVRLEGEFDGPALVLAGDGARLTLTPEGGAVSVQFQTSRAKTSAKWTRTTPVGQGVATGIGGVFFKTRDPKKLRGWYAQHLGLPLSQWGFADIRWRELNDPFRVAHTVWATFKPESNHFDGSFMVNYRVDHLDALVKKLEKDGIKIERREDEPGNGRFAWIRDGENNLVELWEPPPGG
jgi:catechol 2,3-dioxygenase-like lactoylglutathione lyase family enzyme